MCGGGGGHPAPQGGQHPVIIRGGFRGWTPGTGPGRGKITGRPTTNLETHPMCILTSGGDRGGSHQGTANWYRQQQRKGGWLFDRALPTVVGHAFAEVLAGRWSLAEWWAYETNLSRHQPGCRYARLVRALWPAHAGQAALDGGPGAEAA